MIKPILISGIIFLALSGQVYSQNSINFHSPSNIRLFADHLFCQKDFIRASDEYKAYLAKTYNDTVEFKQGLSLQFTGAYDEALTSFHNIPYSSPFYTVSREEYARTLFLQKNYSSLRSYFTRSDPSKDFFPFAGRLNNISYFYTNANLPPKDNFLSVFPEDQKADIQNFYEWKKDSPYKSPWVAGILSTIVPGLGKVYTENYSDGFFAAFLTGIFGYIAYTDFKADHNLRGWIFTGVTAFFYTGNIYGSAASAQIYNAKIRFDFESQLQNFLGLFHYDKGDYNFCK
jgi:hypothetical protein